MRLAPATGLRALTGLLILSNALILGKRPLKRAAVAPCVCANALKCDCLRNTPDSALSEGEYASVRPAVKGYDKWEAFARENRCSLGPYNRIEDDLKRFRNASDPTRPTITQAQIAEAKMLPDVYVCSIRGGKLEAYEDWWAGPTLHKTLERVAKFLPDMDFVVNRMDEPRVLVGDTADIDARLASAECANASEDFHRFKHLHGAVNTRHPDWGRVPTQRLVPVFSQSKINGCYSDLTVPDWSAWDNLLPDEEAAELPPWKQRNGTLYFRGSTTGGHYSPGVDFTRSHRQRLVATAHGKPHMDVAFTAVAQCQDDDVCNKMNEYLSGRGELQPRATRLDNFRHKYLFVIDGNTFISRLPLFLSSGSLVLRAALYSQWTDEWLVPGEHYLPVKFDLSDLESRLRWARSHDAQARAIGHQGRHLARTRFRNEDVECYWGRLLLEYAALVQP